MKSLNEYYKELTEPGQFMKNFKGDQDFLEWLMSGSIEDLEGALKVFEKEEFYEQCQMIVEVIEYKKTGSEPPAK